MRNSPLKMAEREVSVLEPAPVVFLSCFSIPGKKKKIHKTAVVKLGIKDTSICQQELIKLWRRHCILNPVTEFFLEIIYLKKLTGILIAPCCCCLVQTSDLMGHNGVRYPDFCDNIMSSQIKQTVSKISLIYIFFISSFIILIENCSVKACPEGPNQGIMHRWKPGITDSVHSGSGLRLLCHLCHLIPLQRHKVLSHPHPAPLPRHTRTPHVFSDKTEQYFISSPQPLNPGFNIAGIFSVALSRCKPYHQGLVQNLSCSSCQAKYNYVKSRTSLLKFSMLKSPSGGF